MHDDFDHSYYDNDDDDDNIRWPQMAVQALVNSMGGDGAHWPAWQSTSTWNRHRHHHWSSSPSSSIFILCIIYRNHHRVAVNVKLHAGDVQWKPPKSSQQVATSDSDWHIFRWCWWLLWPPQLPWWWRGGRGDRSCRWTVDLSNHLDCLHNYSYHN